MSEDRRNEVVSFLFFGGIVGGIALLLYSCVMPFRDAVLAASVWFVMQGLFSVVLTRRIR